jgi:hypothetical protein
VGDAGRGSHAATLPTGDLGSSSSRSHCSSARPGRPQLVVPKSSGTRGVFLISMLKIIKISFMPSAGPRRAATAISSYAVTAWPEAGRPNTGASRSSKTAASGPSASPTASKFGTQPRAKNSNECLNAFVAGINAYARAHPDQIDPKMRVVLPVTALDILAHAQRVIHFGFVAGPALHQYNHTFLTIGLAGPTLSTPSTAPIFTS